MTTEGLSTEQQKTLFARKNKIIQLLNKQDAMDAAEIIETFLRSQPTSWAHLRTLDSLMQSIFNGEVQVALIAVRPYYIGMMLYKVVEYEEGMRSFKIDFLSCRNFYQYQGLWPIVEQVAEGLGCKMIEAIAHPALAQYACRKLGFVMPAVYVVKPIAATRRN